MKEGRNRLEVIDHTRTMLGIQTCYRHQEGENCKDTVEGLDEFVITVEKDSIYDRQVVER